MKKNKGLILCIVALVFSVGALVVNIVVNIIIAGHRHNLLYP